MRSRSFPEEREEALDPAVDGAPLNRETPLGKPFDNVGVAQAIAHVPAHSQGDDIIGEGMMRESTGGAGGKPSSAIVAAPPLAPSRVCPSLRIRSLSHRMHLMTDPFSSGPVIVPAHADAT